MQIRVWEVVFNGRQPTSLVKVDGQVWNENKEKKNGELFTKRVGPKIGSEVLFRL